MFEIIGVRNDIVKKNYFCRLFFVGLVSIHLVFFTVLPSFAEDISWQDSIAKVEASARKYWDYGRKLDPTNTLGSMYGGVGYEQHQCAILGRMLGFETAIERLEKFDYPLMTTKSDSTELLIFSEFLRNWAAVAAKAVEQSESERKNVWNLECVGKLGISVDLYLKSDSPNADFKVDGDLLVVYGDIENGFHKRLLIVLDENPNIAQVGLGSGGGSVIDALLAGYEIRKRGLNTTLWGNCFSACPLVFFGGVNRYLMANSNRLGFHQVYVGNGESLPFDSQVYVAIATYLNEMGVDQKTVLNWMWSTPPTSMFEPTVDHLCLPRAATFVQRICSSKP